MCLPVLPVRWAVDLLVSQALLTSRRPAMPLLRLMLGELLYMCILTLVFSYQLKGVYVANSP